MSKLRQEQFDILGFIDGFVVKYNTTTAVTVTAGSIEANGSYYTLASDGTHNMTSLAAGFDFHYIYIDDDASTPLTATIIDATTEPAWSNSKRGWYNGDDRCIGIVESPAASATINYFETIVVDSKHIQNVLGAQLGLSLASAMNPTGAWQVPDDDEGATGTPVNAAEIKVLYTNSDSGAAVAIAITTEEMAAINTNILNGLIYDRKYLSISSVDWLPLGATRDLRIGGEDNDDNNLSMKVSGYGYIR